MATRTRDAVTRVASTSEIDAMLEHLPVGVLIAEAPGGRITFINDRAQQLWHGAMPLSNSIEEYSASYQGYRPDGEQYAADEWPLTRAIVHGEIVTDEEIEFLLPGGERRIMLVSARPVFDGFGEIVRGVAVFHDVTEQRQEDRRRDFLMELSDELRVLEDPVAVMEVAAVATGEHLGVSSVSYADVDARSRCALVHAEYRNGRVAPPGKYQLEDFGEELTERLNRGETIVIEDLTSDARATTDVFEGWGLRALVAVPLMQQGRLAAIFTVLHAAPRRWTRSDCALVRQVAERTCHAVETARTQAELRQSREWLTLALRAGSAAIWEWDLRSGEIHWSEEHDAIIGLDSVRHSITFNRWLAIVHPEDRPAAKAAAQRIAAMQQGEVELEYRLAGEGTSRWISMRGRVLADPHGMPRRIVGIAVDATDRKATELEREELLRQAREASEAKSHFISVISHEFRTPLTAIIGYSDLLSTGVSGELAPAQMRQLDRIRTSAWHLTQLVDEILTFSRLEAGRETVTIGPTDALALAREAVALVSPAAAFRQLGLACELPDEQITLLTDSGKLRQVLLNLLGNAVKFTEDGGVTLRVRRIEGAVEFTIQDTGVGIAPEHLDRIFERFWQAQHGNTRFVSGAGLGLTVSLRLIELLGGTLEVDSVLGEGSTFRFRLPG